MNQISPSKKGTSSLSVWLDYLAKIHSTAIDLGLERIGFLARKLNIVKPAKKVITVSGTNGKGSTCAFMEAVLLDAGYSVGVYSSPHLIRYNERVRINGQDLPDEKYIESFDFIEKRRHGVSLSFFEYTTLSALYLFQNANLDIVLLEVGLGGRLDATNIVEHDVSVITSLAIEHTDWLGSNINTIGFEKAGIFRSGKPAICGQLNPPLTVVDYANEIKANFQQIGVHYRYTIARKQTWNWTSDAYSINGLPMPKLPLQNVATGLMALSLSELDFNKSNILNALYNAKLLGRMQLLSSNPTILLDVAHNPHAAEYLSKWIQKSYSSCQIHIVVAMLRDKDVKGTLDMLKFSKQKWYPASLTTERAAFVDELCLHLPNFEGKYSNPTEAFKAAFRSVKIKDMILVLGSFYTVGEILRYWYSKGGQNGK
ncbi:bifunctional protein folC [Candidatus Photodesmus katoptron]|uniref:bifunctional tetrahydrofolate synthase/dihydrofolate synthase n=1 Tax=Candidatus Photodesmus anomalopis TaxID=28176 RepID=UPI0004D574D4|nr:bifunctional tetrahydrofolate synthase/dihydrofolate synthase [Candidatus Photodesmus katoptron]KEY90166.1 bifunctional protein folC [Candidatus Photodesmus katoptron]